MKRKKDKNDIDNYTILFDPYIWVDGKYFGEKFELSVLPSDYELIEKFPERDILFITNKESTNFNSKILNYVHICNIKWISHCFAKNQIVPFKYYLHPTSSDRLLFMDYNFIFHGKMKENHDSKLFYITSRQGLSSEDINKKVKFNVFLVCEQKRLSKSEEKVISEVSFKVNEKWISDFIESGKVPDHRFDKYKTTLKCFKESLQNSCKTEG